MTSNFIAFLIFLNGLFAIFAGSWINAGIAVFLFPLYLVMKNEGER